MSLDRIGTLNSGLGSRYQNLSGGGQPPTLTTVFSPPPDAPVESQGAGRPARHWEDSFGQIEYAVNVALFSGRNHPTDDPESLVRKAIAQAFGSRESQLEPNDAQDLPAMQAYQRALQAHGVSVPKFHEDLVTAVADAQRGRIDPTNVFRNFPVGSSIDAVA
jgi:hypothetical protein